MSTKAKSAPRGKNPVGKRLKLIRQSLGLSQKSLGIKAGIDEFSASARMNQYETGKHVPDFSTLQRIAKVVKVPPAYFYCEDDKLAVLIMEWANLSNTKKSKLLKICGNELREM